jgi:hypothetical protein
LGIERCGKINAVNSDSESCTGIGVVTGFGAVVLILQWPHVRDDDANRKIQLIHILQ